MLKLGMCILRVINRSDVRTRLFSYRLFNRLYSTDRCTLFSNLFADNPYALLKCSVPEIFHYKYMSTDQQHDQDKKFTTLMNFEPVVRPEVFLTLKNWIITKMIVQPYLDKEFAVKEFVRGAKQGLVVVSNFLANGNFEALADLVDDQALSEIKRNHSLLNVKERQDLSVKLADILFTFPYQIGLIFDDNTQKRFCEITVVYHVLKGFEEMKNSGKPLLENAREDMTVCNYRFIREYTKGVQSSWIINRLGHFRLVHLENI